MPELVSAYEKAFKGTCCSLPCLGIPPALCTRWALRYAVLGCLLRRVCACLFLLGRLVDAPNGRRERRVKSGLKRSVSAGWW